MEFSFSFDNLRGSPLAYLKRSASWIERPPCMLPKTGIAVLVCFHPRRQRTGHSRVRTLMPYFVADSIAIIFFQSDEMIETRSVKNLID